MNHSRRYNKNDCKLEYSENIQLLMESNSNEFKTLDSEDISKVNELETMESSTETYTIEQAVETAGMGWYQMKMIFMIGVLSASDAMEMLLLSLLGPALQCQWHLSSEQKAMLTTIVFIGFLMGSFFWGMVSDNYGRKTTFLIVICLISYSGFITSFSPTYTWVILLRCFVGFGIGGASSSFTLLSEFLPSAIRAKVLILYQIWWSFGSSFEVGLAYFILPRYGWRWMVGFSSVPMILSAVLIWWLPESPRFLLSHGKLKESQNIVNNMLITNGKPLMKGTLISEFKIQLFEPPIIGLGFLMDMTYVQGVLKKLKIKNLFYNQYRTTFLLLLVLWFGVTFTYYGIVLLSAEYFSIHISCYQDPTTATFQHIGNITFHDNSCCKALDDNDYKSMLMSSFGEFFVIPINFFLVDLIGRKGTIACSFLLTSIFFMLLNICMPHVWATVIMFGIRGCTAGVFNITYIYTSEVFPTSVRSSATGMCSSFARIAAILTPFVAQVLIPKTSMLTGLMVYSSLALVCFVSTILLPIETKGRPMPQNFQEVNIEMEKR